MQIMYKAIYDKNVRYTFSFNDYFVQDIELGFMGGANISWHLVHP